MSSTNRSKAREDHKSDYYVTPLKPIKDLFNYLSTRDDFSHLFKSNGFLNDLKYFDPCAGGNPSNDKMGFNPMSYPTVLSNLGAFQIETNDIRSDSLADIKSDYINTYVIPNRADVIITNPPFNVATSIIKKAQQEVVDGGCVIMLLRLNFFGSQDRAPFWKDNMPKLSIVHRNRISFTKGSTDSIEYMHAIWVNGLNLNSTELVII